ncbi:hypothetical protein FXW30_05020 [Candidatus Liberibacter asiaticus]|uniref:Uncharacterized protein n=2 Tax=Liberibacter asiaticus TaxID=34021 RepID=C6XGW0_LIBAP|nr:hypothetical protein CLIBASIA_05210 [Candidatus Liberibacter asiaticus str. psy62]AGH17377.1 hypothetical protein WSI_05065 [Candidatus Liberibacter asiaticus str. gxpsy]KAE9509667.1 hypothetical protein FXW22_05030 [Candidatus Liberibacter asiaticus]BAP26909.1 hypothetical protein CGUJ_05210 [Candidatus Liberibacter asiaticus str. Ishi-1]KAE9511515.1 hypothetical protein FXW31_01065 [Candidatus Liberibacter asiaticus]
MDIYDGSWKLISYDPETGRTVWYMLDNQKRCVSDRLSCIPSYGD